MGTLATRQLPVSYVLWPPTGRVFNFTGDPVAPQRLASFVASGVRSRRSGIPRGTQRQGGVGMAWHLGLELRRLVVRHDARGVGASGRSTRI